MDNKEKIIAHFMTMPTLLQDRDDHLRLHRNALEKTNILLQIDAEPSEAVYFGHAYHALAIYARTSDDSIEHQMMKRRIGKLEPHYRNQALTKLATDLIECRNQYKELILLNSEDNEDRQEDVFLKLVEYESEDMQQYLLHAMTEEDRVKYILLEPVVQSAAASLALCSVNDLKSQMEVQFVQNRYLTRKDMPDVEGATVSKKQRPGMN